MGSIGGQSISGNGVFDIFNAEAKGLGGLMGSGGGSNNGMSGAGAAPIANPVNNNQIRTGYDQSQIGMDQQYQLLQALNAQNGTLNQSNVYGQLQGISNGQGPNPAQAMLNQQTGANVANQAALMAGQRGAGANTGLMARQAAMQGANLQQQAVGQGATMQANQAMNAINQMGNIANNQVANRMAGAAQYGNAAQNQYQSLLNAQQGVNNSNVANQASMNAANASTDAAKLKQKGDMFGGLLNSAGPILSMVGGGSSAGSAGSAAGGLGAVGEAVPAIEGGASVAAMAAEGGEVPSSGPSSKFANHILNTPVPRPSHSQTAMANGGKVPAMVSPGEKYLSPRDVEQIKAGKNPAQLGERIPGTPKVSGAKNSYANDTVPKTLDAGGIVEPRSVTQSKNPKKKEAEFVAAILKRDALKGNKK